MDANHLIPFKIGQKSKLKKAPGIVLTSIKPLFI